MKYLKIKIFISSRKVLLIIVLFMILSADCQLIVSRKTDWLNNFMLNVLNKPKLYQVLMLHDQNGINNPQVTEIVEQFSKRFPIRRLTFQEATEKKSLAMSLLPPFINSRTTTLVAKIIASPETLNYSAEKDQTISFMVKLSKSKIRPKCLNIVLQKGISSDYTKFLHQMWSMRFLDMTVLELVEERSITARNEYHFLSSGIEQVIIHRFNPFKNVFMTERYSPKISWFPEKTLNVNGHHMRVGVFNYPALVSLKRNHSGHVIDVLGPDAMLVKTLAQRMNFKVIWIKSKDEEWGSITCNNYSTTGHLYRLVHNELEFTATQGGRFGTCDEHLYEHSRGTITFQLSVVVPVFREKSALSVEWNITYALVIFCLIILTWLLTRFNHFERSDWRFLYLVQVVLGMGTPREPKNIAGRIVFGTILCACLLQSSLIYTAMTAIATRNDAELRLLNLSDVASSGLVPTIGTTFFNLLYNYTDGHSRNLLDNAIKLPGPANKKCLELLSKNRKTACVVREEVARYLIRNEKDSCGRSKMRILDERMSSTASGIFMESESPYVNRFSNLIQRVTESGLYNLWSQNIYSRSTRKVDLDETCSSERPESTLLRKQIIYILLLGYVLSFFSFVCEVAVARFRIQGSRVEIDRFRKIQIE